MIPSRKLIDNNYLVDTFTIKYKGKERIVHHINHSIAFTDGDGEIYINKNLMLYNLQIYRQLLEHELEHDTGEYNSNDLQHDMDIDFPLKTKMDFCLKYPKALYYLSPITITKDKVMISWLQVFTTLVELGMIWLLIWWLVL